MTLGFIHFEIVGQSEDFREAHLQTNNTYNPNFSN